MAKRETYGSEVFLVVTLLLFIIMMYTIYMIVPAYHNVPVQVNQTQPIAPEYIPAQ